MKRPKNKRFTGADQVGVLKKLGQTAAAYCLGLTPRSLRDRPEVPRSADGTYDARAIFRWVAESSIPDPDPMMATGDNSPALERYRAARASLEELKLAERQNHLIDREKMREVHTIVAARYRQFGDFLQREFGREAHDALCEMQDDVARHVDAFLGPPKESAE